MNKLTVPPKGKSAEMMAQLQAEHAAENIELTSEPTHEVTQDTKNEGYNVTSIPVMSTMPEPPATPEETIPSPGEDLGFASVTQPVHLALLTEDPIMRTERFEVAMTRAQSDEIAVVTVRMPASLNRYVDAYVDRVNQLEPGRKYRKQDAIAEAFAAFYADHIMPPAPPDDDL